MRLKQQGRQIDWPTNRHTDGHTDRQTDRKIYILADRQIDRQTDRQTDNIDKQRHTLKATDRATYPDGFEEVQVGQEVTLGAVQPIAGGVADDVLCELGHVAVGDVDKLL